MKNMIAIVAIVLVAGALMGCSCFDACSNPCDPCVAEPVYQSPCCPAPSGGIGMPG